MNAIELERLEKLAEAYRRMPYGGAVLTLSQSEVDGKWIVSDGIKVQADFDRPMDAIKALTAAGFDRLAKWSKWKLKSR